MSEIWVVHMHSHDAWENGGGGFDSWPADEEDKARAAYDHEVAQADTCTLLEVNLYKATAPDGLDQDALDQWVFDNFEVGVPPVTPVRSFLKGEYPAGGCG